MPGPAAVPRCDDAGDVAGQQLALADPEQRADDRADHVAQEAVSDDVIAQFAMFLTQFAQQHGPLPAPGLLGREAAESMAAGARARCLLQRGGIPPAVHRQYPVPLPREPAWSPPAGPHAVPGTPGLAGGLRSE